MPTATARQPSGSSTVTRMATRELALKVMKGASMVADLPFGPRRGPRILIYHQVGSGSGKEMDVPLEAFERQVEWMAGNGRFVALDDVNGASDDAADIFVLTFDDGHQTLYTKAFPLLVDLGVPFTLFITTGPLEERRPLHGDPTMPLVSWPQVSEMLASGLMTVGSHSHEHLDARAHGTAKLEADLSRCDSIIESRVGVRPIHFAYPWGHWSSAADPLVRQRYEAAYVGSGPSIGPRDDRHRVPRIPVMASDSPLSVFARKMWGGFRLETTLRRYRDQLVGPRL